jgi:quinol-cytochrome oxidoreductase complex cytochrome b subunit
VEPLNIAKPNTLLTEKPTLPKRVWRSIFPDPLFPPSGLGKKRFLLKNLILHFRPLSVPEKTLEFSLTWGLGGMAVILVIMQLASGLLLKFIYEPSPVAAYSSIHVIQDDIAFGQLIRNMHHWCANLLVLMAFLHMLRVYFTSAFLPPKQFNWIIGWGLFGLILLANLTGYLLPYDQLAYWAVTVSTGMLEYIPIIGVRLQEMIRGGTEIGPASLRIFYALHTAILPAVLIFFMAFHFWRIRKAGGLVIPVKPETEMEASPKRVPTVPNLLIREIVVALVLIAVVMLTSVLFNAPLGEPANPGLSPNPTKAPWYFAGLQEMLLHLHPLFSVFIIPLLVVIGLLFLPYLNYESDTRGIWFCSHLGRKLAIIGAIGTAGVTIFLVLLDDIYIKKAGLPFGLPPEISEGLLPVLIILVVIFGSYYAVKRLWSASNNEAVQTVFVILLSAFLVLTVISVWFRGEGMALTWPW